MEDEEVFRYIHRLALGLLKQGVFTAFASDAPSNGLYDPNA